MSLCYYCSSGYDRSNSIMMVSSGVEAENAQKARDEVLHQLEMLKNGEFTDRELEETKLFIRTALMATSDSLGAMDSWYLAQTVGGREDVIWVANHTHLDTVYMLMPNENQKEAE